MSFVHGLQFPSLPRSLSSTAQSHWSSFEVEPGPSSEPSEMARFFSTTSEPGTRTIVLLAKSFQTFR